MLCACRTRNSQLRNFLCWEILSTALGFGNTKSWPFMPKSRYTTRYRRMLQALRQARKDAGLTQAQVAKHFDSHASFVSKIESGERRIDVVELADLCQLYGTRLSAFLRQAGLE
jgi:DNA-binding XRE family transcriptional regulator